jgi:hypothetical protein
MYNRTQNENGTYNTRCLFCFMTVASDVESDQELDRLETRHVCPERALAELVARGSQTRPFRRALRFVKDWAPGLAERCPEEAAACL